MSETEKDANMAAAGTATEPSKAGDDQPAGSSLTVAGTSNDGAVATKPDATSSGKEAEKGGSSEARKMGSFPGDLSSIKPVFSLKSKNQ